MLVIATIVGCAFWNPVVKVNGRDVTIRGKGPPVVFSPGLYGAVAPRMYSKLLGGLADEFSIITLSGAGILRRTDMEAIATAIGAESVGLLTHSGFDYSMLQSPRVARAALIDPNALPEVDGVWSVRPRKVAVDVPTLIIANEHAYDGERPFIPDAFDAEFEGSFISYEKRDNFGHCDILDDTWAEWGDRLGIRGYRSESVSSARPFSDWDGAIPRKTVSKERRSSRSSYREAVVERLKTFFTPSLPLVTVEP